jgi:hypothetical protein
MNTRRVTVSLPNYIYEDLLALIPRGGISGFVSEATEEKLLEKKLEPKDPVKAFLALRKVTPKLNDRQIMEAIRRGRA